MQFKDVIASFGSGIRVGFIGLAFFGAVLYVRAVAPGSTINPIFGPLDADVNPPIQLKCMRVGPLNPAACSSLGIGWELMGAGGYCPSSGGDNPRITPQITGDVVTSCDGSSQESYAVCCKIST